VGYKLDVSGYEVTSSLTRVSRYLGWCGGKYLSVMGPSLYLFRPSDNCLISRPYIPHGFAQGSESTEKSDQDDWIMYSGT
jgi:hypothetical protein